MHEWSRVVWAVLRPRYRAARRLGLHRDELESLAGMAAVEAELSWVPDGGRSLSSWVYLCVEFAVRKRLAKVAREFADDEMDEWVMDPDEGPEARVVVSEALVYLQARLTQAEWWLLWMYHGEGYSAKELSKQLGLAYGTVRNQLSAARRNAMTILNHAEG